MLVLRVTLKNKKNKKSSLEVSLTRVFAKILQATIIRNRGNRWSVFMDTIYCKLAS